MRVKDEFEFYFLFIIPLFNGAEIITPGSILVDALRRIEFILDLASRHHGKNCTADA